jgi:uncharacterized protein YbbK (DUF523 family)
MEKVLVSRCLLGELCRYDAKPLNANCIEQLTGFELYPICPEMDGGLPCPRPRAEIESGNGNDVLDGLAKVKDDQGMDVTAYFLKGAQAALSLALANSLKKAILKEKSPSCGINLIYIEGRLTAGSGVTAALLKRNGLEIISVE